MVCNLCGVNEATIHLTEIHNAQMVEIHLCESCAHEKGTDFKTHFNLQEVFEKIADPASWLSIGENPVLTETCKNCGLTFEELSKKGRLGCPECYVVFEEALLPLIRRVQRSSQHLGKTPSRLQKKQKGVSDLTHLQKKLRLCIQNEDFEQAAKIRDEIKKFEEKIKKKKRDTKG